MTCLVVSHYSRGMSILLLNLLIVRSKIIAIVMIDISMLHAYSEYKR